jgi:hypothetical protein
MYLAARLVATARRLKLRFIRLCPGFHAPEEAAGRRGNLSRAGGRLPEPVGASQSMGVASVRLT